MRSGATDAVDPPAAPDARARRRALRREESQTQILDAAERVFGEHGVQAGSLREIALLSGFSTASIYLFFENKQHLVSATLIRRGAELVAALHEVADCDLSPLDKLHRNVDVSVAFFEARPDFRQLLRHLTGGEPLIGPSLVEFGEGNAGHFVEAMTIVAGIVSQGQDAGEIRDGDPRAIAHLYSVLINEHVLLAAGGESGGGTLTSHQFHELIDGALRSPQTRLVPKGNT